MQVVIPHQTILVGSKAIAPGTKGLNGPRSPPPRTIYQSKQCPPAEQAGPVSLASQKRRRVRDYIRNRGVTISDVRHAIARVRGAAHLNLFYGRGDGT